MNRLGRAAGAAALLTAVMCAGAIPSAWAGCPNQDLATSRMSIQEVRDSVACLINEERESSGLGPLAIHVSLQQAAQHHSKAMNKKNFVGHQGVQSRVRRAGYLRGASRWSLGEVIGWGSGSPKWVVAAWMRSPIHRATLLTPGYQEMGIGLVHGSPLTSKRKRGWGTFTVDFGSSLP